MGVCGKTPEVAGKHNELTAALIGLARAAQGKKTSQKADELVSRGYLPPLPMSTSIPAASMN
jgi:hydroxylamine reductase